MNLDNMSAEVSKAMDKQDKKPLSSRLPHFLLVLAMHGAILYYLYNLEDAECNCIRDWRHNFVKGMCLLIIFMNFMSLLGNSLKAYKWLAMIKFILIIVDVYAFFTYVGDLNDTQCSCAVNKQPNLNSIMNFMRWLFAIIIGLSLLVAIAFIILGFSIIKSLAK